MNGQLEKVTIRAFRDKKRRTQLVGAFVLPINPENFSKNLAIKNDTSQAIGKGGNNPKHISTAPEKLQLDFYFDNTCAFMGNLLEDVPVPIQIKQFLAIVYDIESEKHDPLFLSISWGAYFIFDGKLEDVSIEYKLFGPSGEPTRAKISAKFIAFTDAEEQELKDNKKSPDLTKFRKVKELDKLPLMTYNLYGDSKYYWQVAEANQLTSFRNLKPGKDLTFPSINKAAS